MNEAHFTGNPPNYQNILNALPARDRPTRPRIPVRAHLNWETDGEEWHDGEALRLDPGAAIFVELHDPRCRFTGVWLRPEDVWWGGKTPGPG